MKFIDGVFSIVMMALCISLFLSLLDSCSGNHANAATRANPKVIQQQSIPGQHFLGISEYTIPPA